MTSRFILKQSLKAFVQKGYISLFGSIFIFCKIAQANFWQTDLFDMRSIVPLLFLSICISFSRNNVCKKLSFASGIFMSESFQGGFRRDANLNEYF